LFFNSSKVSFGVKPEAKNAPAIEPALTPEITSGLIPFSINACIAP